MLQKEENTAFSFMETWMEARRKRALGQEPDEEKLEHEVEQQKKQKERK